ncbi:MAG: hypothetical protein Q7R54_01725 [bacterium]|nr:hypothetical protein [bacterium]
MNLFPHFIHFFSLLTVLEWSLIGILIGVKLRLNSNAAETLRRELEMFPTRQELRTLGGEITDAVLKQLPTAINDDQQRKLHEITEEMARLREEREWVKIGVVLYGMPDDGDRITYAPVMLNINTGELKAVDLEFRIFMTTLDGNPWWSTYSGAAPKTLLGAPRYEKLKNSQQIVLLGVVYTRV